MPKYSFKRNLFFALFGGWLILAYSPHLTFIMSATPRIVSAAQRILLAALLIVSAAPCILSAIQSITRNIQWTSSLKFF